MIKLDLCIPTSYFEKSWYSLILGSFDLGLAAAIMTVIAVALISHLKEDAGRDDWRA
jgi:hypothetical protein